MERMATARQQSPRQHDEHRRSNTPTTDQITLLTESAAADTCPWWGRGLGWKAAILRAGLPETVRLLGTPQLVFGQHGAGFGRARRNAWTTIERRCRSA